MLSYAAGAVSGVRAPAILGLQELLLGQKFSRDLVAEGKARLWTIPVEDFNRLVQDHADLGLLLFQEMSQGLGSALEVPLPHLALPTVPSRKILCLE